jgi:hypothetical protein
MNNTALAVIRIRIQPEEVMLVQMACCWPEFTLRPAKSKAAAGPRLLGRELRFQPFQSAD